MVAASPTSSMTKFSTLFIAGALCSAALSAQGFVPGDLSPGQTYRVLVVTDAERDGTSSNIADYDAFVSADVVNAPELAALNTNWRAVASTDSVDANVHTGTFTPGGVPIYLPNGLRVFNDYDHMWDPASALPLVAPNLTVSGGIPASRTWTGTYAFGVSQSSPLGGASGFADGGAPSSSGYSWIWANNLSQTTLRPLYAISDVQTVPVPNPANSTAFGSGCGAKSEAFYDVMPSSGFDLGGTAVELLSWGANRYHVQSGGTYVPPSAAATTLVLGDDDEVSVNLVGYFSYHNVPAGSAFTNTTTELVVCSNGYVSAATGNGTGYTPDVTEWLASPEARWGTWHDFNPAATGSVKFEQVGTIAYVTWEGVVSFGTNDVNTMQLQFDLIFGVVTMVWPSMIASGNEWLVGYASGTGDYDLGNTDVSTSLPFETGHSNNLDVVLSSSLPQLGSNCILTTNEMPAGTFFAMQTLGLTAFDPGIALSFIGMPDCFANCSLDAIYSMSVTGTSATYSLAIPSQANLVGFQVSAQTTVFDQDANDFGFTSSNGVLLTLGN